jgi:hypothetical protein
VPPSGHKRAFPSVAYFQRRRSGFRKPDASGDPWWDSKIMLLVLGAILTNFLAPHIQDNLQTIRWRRQQQVQQARQSIDAMNRFMRDFADLQALSSRMDTMSRLALSPHPTEARKARYEVEFDRSFKDWYAQTAKVSGELTLFKETGKIRESFQTYCSVTSEALLSYREAVLDGDLSRLQSKRGLWSDQINNLYETVLNSTRKEVFQENIELTQELGRRLSPWSLF